MRRSYIGIGALFALAIFAIVSNYAVSASAVSDHERLQEISAINNAIATYADRHKNLPTSLNQLPFSKLKLQEHLSRYAYKDMGRSTDGYDYQYQICTTFRSAAGKSDDFANGDYVDASTGHGKGYQCTTGKTPAPPQVTICGKNFLNIDGLSQKYTIESFVPNSSSMIVRDEQNAQYAGGAPRYTLTWRTVPVVYDSECRIIDISALKPSDKIEVYDTSAGSSSVAVIHRTSANVKPPQPR